MKALQNIHCPARIQLVIVSTIAPKYLYQRSTCPRVWTRTAAYDPELVMRGRYLSLQLTVDGCSSTLPSAKQAEFPRNINGVPSGKAFAHPFRRHNLVPGKARRQRQQADRDSRSRSRHIITRGQRSRGPGASCEQCASPSPSISTSPNTQLTHPAADTARNYGLKSPSRQRPAPSTSTGAQRQWRMEAARISVRIAGQIAEISA